VPACNNQNVGDGLGCSAKDHHHPRNSSPRRRESWASTLAIWLLSARSPASASVSAVLLVAAARYERNGSVSSSAESGSDSGVLGLGAQASWMLGLSLLPFVMNVSAEESDGSKPEGPGEASSSSLMQMDDPVLTMAEAGEYPSVPERTRALNLDRQRSWDETYLNDLSTSNLSPVFSFKNLETLRIPENLESINSPRKSYLNTPRSLYCPEPQIVTEAWDTVRQALVYFRGQPVGTIAALDYSGEVYNYNQVFVRDFVPSGLAFLMNGEPDIVKNFLLKTLRLQSWEKQIDRFKLGAGVMPASFKVYQDPVRNNETLIADFGESAIGRVAPVDSGFWWIFLLRAYTRATGDHSLADMPECQRGMRLILNLCLSEGFDTFPTLLCADGCCMIDRRMCHVKAEGLVIVASLGVYGYPIEIQALFFMALRCALYLLKPDDEGEEFIEKIRNRLTALSYHMRSYFWLDFRQLNTIYRYKTEEYSHTAVNKFNVMPDSLPNWVFDFMPINGGYFIGNLSPGRMDFRWFCLGNCIAILSCLATEVQSAAIMDLIEERWTDLVAEMPLKICYPALENHEWRIVTGCDPKNTRWSYHNGGSWPVLLWLLTAASIKTGRPHIARRAIELAETRLLKDNWPEYYDGRLGRFVGKQAMKSQIWSAAGYLVSKLMLEDPTNLVMVALEEDKKMKPVIKRSASWSC
ncbi:hypothetical protein Taro_011361, partial [Colocasia esculenta]|nr:hypothetical protein [Colocasia esculenta]